MSILVIGGTGKVGSETLKALLSRGLSVRVMTRSADKLASLPAGAQGVVGDLEKPETLREAFRGAESLFLLVPVSPTETQQGLAAVEAAKAAGVRRIVYMSVGMPPGSDHIPHFRSKVPVEQAVQKSGLAWALLRPNNFYQNDLQFQEALTRHGVYPQPIGNKGIARVDVRDIADAAVNTLTQPGLAGQIYPLNGPEALTGEAVARVYARHLGREVLYAGDDLDTWAAQLKGFLPEWMLHDFRIMYEYFQRQGWAASDAEYALQRKAVGHDPRPFEPFVGEVAALWRGTRAEYGERARQRSAT